MNKCAATEMTKIIRVICAWCLIATVPLGTSYAKQNIEYFPDKKGTFYNFDCKRTQLCSLKEFSIYFQKVNVKFPFGDNYSTRMFASYTTKDINSLEDYGLVQFIQGCHFQSLLKGNRVEKYRRMKRQSFDISTPFLHPELIVDSRDTDPLFSSDSRYSDRKATYSMEQGKRITIKRN